MKLIGMMKHFLDNSFTSIGWDQARRRERVFFSKIMGVDPDTGGPHRGDPVGRMPMCVNCVFLGVVKHDLKDADAYYCPDLRNVYIRKDFEGDLVARDLDHLTSSQVEAVELALLHGLINEDSKLHGFRRTENTNYATVRKVLSIYRQKEAV